MNITWYWGTSSSCSDYYGRNSSVSNDTYYMTNGANFSSNNQKYYWKVCVNDGHGEWANATYHFTTIGANKEIISKDQSAYSLELNPGCTTLYGYINNNSVSTSIDTNWHYVALTFSGSTMTLYKDGESVDTGSSSMNSNENDVVLGNLLTGTLDELRISNTARSASWINTTYQNTNSPTTFATFGSQIGILSTWTYRKLVTIDSSLVGSDLTNFPVLISTTDTDLKNNALSNGYDILFMSPSVDWNNGSYTQKYPHEIEKYTSSTGELIAWVNIDSVSSSTNTTMYMYYGNSLCTADRQNVTGVWDSDYVGVWHLHESPSDSGTHYDSTSNDHDMTFYDSNSNSNTDATGIADGSDDLNGDADYMDESYSSDFDLSSFTLECWVQLDEKTDNHYMINKQLDNYTDRNFALYSNISTGQPVMSFRNSGDTNETVTGTTDLTSTGWHYIAGTNDGSTLILYVNGSSEGTPVSITSSPLTQSAPLMIGRENNSVDPEYWDGDFDEIRISKTSRSSNWISTTYNTISNPSNFITFGSQKTKNVAPSQSSSSPSNGATNQNLNPQLSIMVNDTNTDSLNVSFWTNASSGWQQLGDYHIGYNGTYIDSNTSNMNNYGTTYYWSVNVTDGATWTNATYNFTTDVLPQIINEIPANESTGISTWPACNITVSDLDSGTVNVYFYENATGGWALRQTNSSVNVTSAANVIWGNYTNADTASTKYWWSVNVTDRISWTNETYHFTTES